MITERPGLEPVRHVCDTEDIVRIGADMGLFAGENIAQAALERLAHVQHADMFGRQQRPGGMRALRGLAISSSEATGPMRRLQRDRSPGGIGEFAKTV